MRIEQYKLVVGFGAGELPVTGNSFYSVEGVGSDHPVRWTGPEPCFAFDLHIDRSRPALVCLFIFNSVSAHNLRNTFAEIDGVVIEVVCIKRERVSILTFVAPARMIDGLTKVVYHTVETRLAGNGDDRLLGYLLYRLEIREFEAASNGSESGVHFSFGKARCVSGYVSSDWKDAMLHFDDFKLEDIYLSAFEIKLFKAYDVCGIELRPNFAGDVIEWGRQVLEDEHGKFVRICAKMGDSGGLELVLVSGDLDEREGSIVRTIAKGLPSVISESEGLSTSAEYNTWRSCCFALSEAAVNSEVRGGFAEQQSQF